MRFVPVWIYLHSMSLGAAINYKIFLFYSRIIKVGLSLYKLLPLEIIFGMLHVMRFLRCIGKHQKALTLVANENKRCLLNDTRIVDFTWIAQRRKALDYAATYGKNQRVVSQLENCAYQLDQFVKPLHQSRKPVILAPLHMVSDILAGIVASKTYPGKGTVIVSANAEQYKEQDRMRGGVNLTYCSIHEQRQGVAKNMISACMDAAENKSNIIIFPDITPDYTLGTHSATSSKLTCRLFGRQARLHNGIVRLAKMLSAEVVFYYLYYDHGVKIHIYPAVGAESVEEMMPEIIERSIRAKPQDWLLWHLHSLYFINE